LLLRPTSFYGLAATIVRSRWRMAQAAGPTSSLERKARRPRGLQLITTNRSEVSPSVSLEVLSRPERFSHEARVRLWIRPAPRHDVGRSCGHFSASTATHLLLMNLPFRFELQTSLLTSTPCQVKTLICSPWSSGTIAHLYEVQLQCCSRSSDTSVEVLKRLDIRSNQFWGARARHGTTRSFGCWRAYQYTRASDKRLIEW